MNCSQQWTERGSGNDEERITDTHTIAESGAIAEYVPRQLILHEPNTS